MLPPHQRSYAWSAAANAAVPLPPGDRLPARQPAAAVRWAEAVVAFVLRATDLHHAIPQFHHRSAFGVRGFMGPQLYLACPASGNVAAAANSVPPPASRRSFIRGPACGSLPRAPSPNWVDVGLTVGDHRHHLRWLQHLFGLLRGVHPVHHSRSASVAGDAGRVYPVTAPDIAADQAETRSACSVHRDHRVSNTPYAFPFPTGPRPGGAVPWWGTSPRYDLGSPGRAVRHRPRRSDRTSPQPALLPSLSGWRRTAQPAIHPCGRLPARAGTPSYAKTSVRGFAPPFIEAHITECPERQFHSGSCWSVAAGSELWTRRARKKFAKVPIRHYMCACASAKAGTAWVPAFAGNDEQGRGPCVSDNSIIPPRVLRA